MRILLIGANGFVGKHLLKHLMARGHTVLAGVHHLVSEADLSLTFQLDIQNIEQLSHIIRQTTPDCIVNLAAVSMVSKSWENPALTFQVNVNGVLNIIESIRQINPNIKLINIGSGQEYGLTAASGQPIEEHESCHPQNPYAYSKFVSGEMALMLADKYQLSVLHVRAFNHFGPGQQKGFLISDICSKIVAIERGLSSTYIEVGNLDIKRDFIDVRDVVHAYSLMIEGNLVNGIYNICSGEAYQLNYIVNTLLDLSHCQIKLSKDTNKIRAQEVSIILGSYRKLQQVVGWKPSYKLEDSLQHTLTWWRNQF